VEVDDVGETPFEARRASFSVDVDVNAAHSLGLKVSAGSVGPNFVCPAPT
jgi:hypothetical protein